MPVCERYEGQLPLKMAEYNLPLHVQTEDEEFVGEENYHNNGMTSPHDLGPWIEDQSDGGGKFRLKRRRRCGQCGPCQVKENCGKCQYCVRKDVLKQACIYRKCVYLRKPVPRFRPEGSSSGSSSSGVSGGGSASSGGLGCNNSNSGTKSSPHKPPSSSASTMTNHHGSHPNASPFNSSAVAAAAAAAAAAQSAELSSCQLAQSPFGLPMNNGMIDHLRGSALDQHRGALFDATSMLDPSRTSYVQGGRTLEPGRSPALDLGRNTNTADSGFGTSGSSLPTSPANSNKDRPTPREQFRSPMEQWGAMPYGFPRNPWAYPTLQPNPAAAYGFQSAPNPFTNPFGSSCRLGMADPTSHFAAPPQPTFHPNMSFQRHDLASSANFVGTAPGMRPTMAPPFYPPPPHIPASLPNFPSFNQLPSSAGPPGSYSMPHPPMYPGNFYSSFRPPNEPQIYYAYFPPPFEPFSDPLRFGALSPPFKSKYLNSKFQKYDKAEKVLSDIEEVLHKRPKTDFLHRKHNFTRGVQVKKLDLTKEAQDFDRTMDKIGKGLLREEETIHVDLNDEVGTLHHKTVHDKQLPVLSGTTIDEDLQQQIRQSLGRGECNVISIDDFKLQAFIRSDGFNNLEIEIDSPLSPVPWHSNNQQHSHHAGPFMHRLISQESSASDSQEEVSHFHLSDESISQGYCENDYHKSVSDADLRIGDTLNSVCDHNVSVNTATVSDVYPVLLHAEIQVKQEQHDEESVLELEIAGTELVVEDVVLDEEIIGLSSNPQELVRFLNNCASPSSSPVPEPASPQMQIIPS